MNFYFRLTTHPERGVPMVEILRGPYVIGTLAGSDDGRALQLTSNHMMGAMFDQRGDPTLHIEIEDGTEE